MTDLSRTTFPAKPMFAEDGTGWLNLLHKVNEALPGTFGSPIIKSDGLYTEVYPGARVEFSPAGNFTTVEIIATDPEVAEAIRLLTAKEA